MSATMGFFDRLAIAFEAMMHWETLVTLGGFIAIWLLFRSLADPWAREGRHRRKPSVRKPVLPENPPAGDDSLDEDDDRFLD